jgi:uncharacterized protein (UPF0335 family)
MTDNERIDKLEDRVDRLETSIANDLRRIFEKLEKLSIDGARTACPSPGACINLSNDLTHGMKLLTAVTLRVERLELQLIALNQQKAWIMGAWAVVAIIAAAIGSLGGIIIAHYIGKL